MNTRQDWKTLHDMLNSMEWNRWQCDRLGNDLFLSDPERADRIWKASEDGADGSTHAEHLKDMRDFLDGLKVFDPEWDDAEELERFDLPKADFDRLTAEIVACERWHADHGSLFDEIG